MSVVKYGISDSSVVNSNVWNTTKTVAIPDNKNRSPTLLIKKALVAALHACARVYQKPINK
jgi:hypothetical protein